MLTLNLRAKIFATHLIEGGVIDTGDTFELAPADIEALHAGEPGRYYLGLDTSQPVEDPNRWRHPVGKIVGGEFKVFKAALEAIVDLEIDSSAIRSSAMELLGFIDTGDTDCGDGAGDGGDGDTDTDASADDTDNDKPDDPAQHFEDAGDGGGDGRLTGAELVRALEARDPRAAAQVRADMRERRQLVGADAVREVLGTNEFTTTLSLRAEAVDETARTARLSFSSEEPYQRWSWDGPYMEILGHNDDEVMLDRLNSGGALLVNHNTDDQVGVIRKAEIGKDRKGRALVEFSKSVRAGEILKDVADGIRRNTSVGYLVHSMKLVEEHDDKPDDYRVTLWEPLEVTIAAIPADYTVGSGRKLELSGRSASNPEKEQSDMKKLRSFMDVPGDPPGGGKSDISVDVADIQKKARAAERERINQILALGKEHNLDELAREHADKGTALADFHPILLEAIADGASKPVRSGGVDEIGLTEKEARNFSVIKAIRALAAEVGLDRFSKADIDRAGFELECSAATGKLLKQDSQGILLPMEVLRTPLIDPRERAAAMLMNGFYRDMNVASDPAGGYLVDTTMMAMVPMLRNLCLLLKLGATGMGGLVGDIAISRQVSGTSTYWLNEDGEPTESDPVWAQLGLNPHTVGATTDVTRKLLKQASIDVEAFIRNCIISDIAVEFDRVGINGSGHSGEPLGILNTTGIGAVADSGGNGSAPVWDDVVNTFKELALDNINIAGLGWLASVHLACKLMRTKMDGTNLPFIMSGFDENGMTKLMGLKCGVTNNVPSDLAVGSGTSLSAMIAGHFPDCIMTQWGTIDLNVDKTAKVLSGGIRVVGLADVDVGLRRPQSFSAKADCITT